MCKKLPDDRLSVENELIVNFSKKYPLCINTKKFIIIEAEILEELENSDHDKIKNFSTINGINCIENIDPEVESSTNRFLKI